MVKAAEDHKLEAKVAHETRAEGDLTTNPKAEAAAKAKAAAAEKQAILDHFGELNGAFANAVDRLGNTHELRMAKSHLHQAHEWVHRHLHPDPSSKMPDAPPPVPPLAAG